MVKASQTSGYGRGKEGPRMAWGAKIPLFSLGDEGKVTRRFGNKFSVEFELLIGPRIRMAGRQLCLGLSHQ